MQNNVKLFGFKVTPKQHPISSITFYRSVYGTVDFIVAEKKSRCLSLSTTWARRHKNLMRFIHKRKGVE